MLTDVGYRCWYTVSIRGVSLWACEFPLTHQRCCYGISLCTQYPESGVEERSAFDIDVRYAPAAVFLWALKCGHRNPERCALPNKPGTHGRKLFHVHGDWWKYLRHIPYFREAQLNILYSLCQKLGSDIGSSCLCAYHS